jgi:hypothetical protein
VAFWAASERSCEADAPARGILQIVKEPESLTAVIEQLMYSPICYPNRNAGSSSKKVAGRGEDGVELMTGDSPRQQHQPCQHPPLAKNARSGAPRTNSKARFEVDFS